MSILKGFYIQPAALPELRLTVGAAYPQLFAFLQLP
jgi:hypothetical protein